jgi:hypothetical protein
MSDLWNPDEHEPLGVEPGSWEPGRARAAITAIVERTLAAYEPGRFWPRHPADEYEREHDRDLCAWIGAAGVLWGLDRLGAGLGEADVYGAYLERPDLPGSLGLMQGETGVLLISWRLAPTPAKLDRLLALVRRNLASPSDELFDGVPGTMLAALHVHRITGSEAAAGAWRECAELMLSRFTLDPELQRCIWIQRRRGRLLRSIGAGHGFASNVCSLLGGRELLDPERSAWFAREARQTALTLAQAHDGLVNWATAADAYWADRFPTRVQWCHGAPGLITSLSDLPSDPTLDATLSAAGELVWRAGPLRKGAGICHGTAGNALALLALHARSGEARWLERARAFALHALRRVESARPRHSLWTGDIGVALVLDACLRGYEGLPIIDIL